MSWGEQVDGAAHLDASLPSRNAWNGIWRATIWIFEAKTADFIDPYIWISATTPVFCGGEKAAIQALDRVDSVLPLSPGRTERHGFEYYRHGTPSLYAALDVKIWRTNR
jgi:hypothetical protein